MEESLEETNLDVCTAQIGHRFDCLAATLEMPFKDNVYAPQPETGWSGERSRRLGEQAVEAISAVLGDLR